MVGEWVPLLEYAVKKGVSISTLRRYIKTERIQYKLEKGRYFIFDSSLSAISPVASTDANPIQLEAELRCARKEIAELKMLVAFYEDKFSDGATN